MSMKSTYFATLIGSASLHSSLWETLIYRSTLFVFKLNTEIPSMYYSFLSNSNMKSLWWLAGKVS